ncbi:hypothetical protein HNO89_003566 [Sporosarcina luteola]|nr:hypothetical protein [Sporosarcina luteola]
MRLSILQPFIYYARMEQKRLFRAFANVKNRNRFAGRKEGREHVSVCLQTASIGITEKTWQQRSAVAGE